VEAIHRARSFGGDATVLADYALTTNDDLNGNPGQQRFTIRSGVLTSSDRSGTAQVSVAHCPNERTLDPAVCFYKYHTLNDCII